MTFNPDAVLLVGHGTVADLSEIPAFLHKIRRGRPASPELIHEITMHYEKIGGSPLLAITEQQAQALAKLTGLRCAVGMRLWEPLVENVVRDLVTAEVRRIVVLPLAPFSVELYFQAATRALDAAGLSSQVELRTVAPWGSHPRFIGAWAKAIREALASKPAAQLVLTAHSLPTQVIRAGDNYQRELSDTALKLCEELKINGTLAFQSQGADGGDWLGPTLSDTLVKLQSQGCRSVVLAPIGFLSDHVETLYDLDIEAKAQAATLGLEFTRLPALNTAPGLIETLADLVKAACQ